MQPELADQIPEDVQVELVMVGSQDFAKQTLAVAGDIRLLGIVAPLLAVLALIASIVASAGPPRGGPARGGRDRGRGTAPSRSS